MTWIQKYNFLLPILLTVGCLFSADASRAQILHLELGAANYGKVSGLSKEAESRRFQVLEKTVEGLVNKYGPTGIIYLNDRNDSGLEIATEYLREWLKSAGLPGITVEPIPGDYNLIPLPHVKTAHMTNPMTTQMPVLPEGMQRNQKTHWMHAGTGNLTHSEFNRLVTEDILRLARHSETGLRISTYFFDGIKNLTKLLPKGSLVESEDPSLPYYSREGEPYSFMPVPRVYIVKPSSKNMNQSEKTSHSCAPILESNIENGPLQVTGRQRHSERY